MMAKRNAPKGRRRRNARVENRDPHHANAAHSAGLPQAIPLAIPTSWTPEAALAVFELVSRHRNGVAMAEAKLGLCTICHVRLRPQVFNTVLKNEQILQCDSCQRILYYTPAPIAPADSVPQPAS